MAQFFKGDAEEQKMYGAGAPAFALTKASLDEFWAEAYDSTPWLLQLYDENRMPFSQRVNRNAFVAFIREALKRFPFTGNFDSYLFVIWAIFGSDANIIFTVTAPGKLSIDVNAISGLEFDFIGKGFDGSGFETFNVTTMDGDQIIFRGIAGIETEYELQLLFSELMPAGIVPNISLTFFDYSPFIGEDGSGTFNMISHDGDQLVFWEIGG